MSDQVTRRAARMAALVAVPVAVLVGVGAYQVLDVGGEGGAGDPTVTQRPARPMPTAPVDLPAPALAATPAAVCRTLLAALPERFADLPRRPVTAGPQQNAAYGEPPVTVTCGVPGPEPPAGAQFFEIDHVCWYADQRGAATVWTVRGRQVPVVVTVPTEYPGEYLVDLAKPVAEANPATASACG